MMSILRPFLDGDEDSSDEFDGMDMDGLKRMPSAGRKKLREQLAAMQPSVPNPQVWY